MRRTQYLRYGIDCGMAIFFLVTFVTGLVKWTFLLRTLGLTAVILPVALLSDIHDWAGFLLGFVVAVHLWMNRAWILSMTKNVLAGMPDED